MTKRWSGTICIMISKEDKGTQHIGGCSSIRGCTRGWYRKLPKLKPGKRCSIFFWSTVFGTTQSLVGSSTLGSITKINVVDTNKERTIVLYYLLFIILICDYIIWIVWLCFEGLRSSYWNENFEWNRMESSSCATENWLSRCRSPRQWTMMNGGW